MQDNLKGKRLLVLGGSIWKESIRRFADEYGVVLVSAGLYPAGTDSIADEVYRIDTTVPDLMTDFVREKRIDGVYMGGSELIISSACVWIQRVGLPCYCTPGQWNALQNKNSFKRVCREAGLPVVPDYKLDYDDPHLEDSAFPVAVKPADGCGSSGFSVCHDNAQLREGVRKALQLSPSGSVICEKFVRNSALVVFYSIDGDKVRFVGAEDKIPVRFPGEDAYVGGLFVFPSRVQVEFNKRFDSKVAAMFRQLGVREGSAWMEVFCDGDSFYFNEAGFRYGGIVSVLPVNYISGVNQVYRDLYFAISGRSLSGPCTPLVSADIPRGLNYAVYPVYARPGTICAIKGVSGIRGLDGVVAFIASKGVGAVIKERADFSRNVALVHFVYRDSAQLRHTIREVHRLLRLEDENGENMVQSILDETI